MSTSAPWGPVVVEGTIPAFKAAYLVEDSNGLPCFCGAGVGTTYGPADAAQCVHIAEHVPPHPGCGCGFYGWRHRDDAVALLTDRLVAVLDVELWGRFHEFERGFIAAAQNVNRVTLSPWCTVCLTKGREPFQRAVGLVGKPFVVTNELVPACQQHAEDAEIQVGVDELARALGVEVAWASEEDAVAAVAREIKASLHPVRRRHFRSLGDLLPGEVAYVFSNAISQDATGSLWIDPQARLIQPLPGTDIPLRLGDDGRHEVLLGNVIAPSWRDRDDPHRFALCVRAIGLARASSEDHSESPNDTCSSDNAETAVRQRDGEVGA